jgi:hypothetical protein
VRSHCRHRSPPLVRRLGSEDPERRSRDEMTLKGEGVVDGGMHTQKALSGPSGFEPRILRSRRPRHVPMEMPRRGSSHQSAWKLASVCSMRSHCSREKVLDGVEAGGRGRGEVEGPARMTRQPSHYPRLREGRLWDACGWHSCRGRRG